MKSGTEIHIFHYAHRMSFVQGGGWSPTQQFLRVHIKLASQETLTHKNLTLTICCFFKKKLRIVSHFFFFCLSQNHYCICPACMLPTPTSLFHLPSPSGWILSFLLHLIQQYYCIWYRVLISSVCLSPHQTVSFWRAEMESGLVMISQTYFIV